jgi:hypothetical protein
VLAEDSQIIVSQASEERDLRQIGWLRSNGHVR